MEPQGQSVRSNEALLPHPTASDLRGRQSVRATFTLSPKAIEAISIVAALLGIKQKSIFDHLIEDAHSLMLIAGKIDHESLKEMERVQKTFVISRKALASLENAAQETGASRDALVELSIQRLMPIIARERKKFGIRKQILDQMNHFLDEGIRLLTVFETDLGDDDPFATHFKNAIQALVSANNEISGLVRRGDIVKNFDLQHLTVSTNSPNEKGKDYNNHSKKNET